MSNECAIPESRDQESDFSSLLNQQKKMPSWFFFLSLFIAVIFMVGLVYIFIPSPDENLKTLNNNELALPLKSTILLPATEVVDTVKVVGVTSVEVIKSSEAEQVNKEEKLSKPIELISADTNAQLKVTSKAEVDSTATILTQTWPSVENFVKQEAKNFNETAYFPLDVASNVDEFSVYAFITSDELIGSASEEILAKVNLNMLAHPVISPEQLLEKLKVVFLTKSEINTWLTEVDGSRYVLQISLVASKERLINYLQNYGHYQDLNFYRSKNGFALVFGNYKNASHARLAIDKLPKAFQTKDIWARSVSSIQRLIKQEETIE